MPGIRALAVRSLFVLAILAASAMAALFLLATSSRPAVNLDTGPAVADLDRARVILRKLGLRELREGRWREGETRVVELTPDELRLGLDHLLADFGGGRARVETTDHRLRLLVSWRLPAALPGDRFANLSLTLATDGQRPILEAIRLGRLPLPPSLVTRAGRYLLTRHENGDRIEATLTSALAMLTRVGIGAGGLRLEYVWRGRHLVEALTLPGVDAATLTEYRRVLARVGGRELLPYLRAAFALAERRAHAGEQGDPVVENRAALAALAEIALGAELIRPDGRLPPLGKGRVRLAGRTDLAQHFALSAFLAARGGSHLSDLAGLYKELRDARGGSGFSFADLAADKAGARFGSACVTSPESARRIQARLREINDSAVFFPSLAGLPEFLPESAFLRRYGGIGAPAYLELEADIEQRVDRLDLYRPG